MKLGNCKIDKLSFVHIPKTAGLSLHTELENYFGEENSLRIACENDRKLFLAMDRERVKNYAYITGHISMEELLMKGINYPTIAVVREPVKRLISLQQYQNASNHEEHKNINFTNFEMLLQDMLLKRELNLQCWHLCGRPNFELAVESIRKNNILVVPLDCYQELIDTLSDLLGIQLKNVHSNVTTYKNSVDVDNIERELLDTLVGDDFKLFSHVTQNYKAMKHAFIDSITRLNQQIF